MDEDDVATLVAQLANLLMAQGRLLAWRYHNAQILLTVPSDIPSPVVIRREERPVEDDGTYDSPAGEAVAEEVMAEEVTVEFVAVVSARRRIKAPSFSELGDQLAAEGYRMADARDNGDGLTVPHPDRDPALVMTEEVL